jgi:NhaP-type Na+/H+ or K+/H+ antiporter
MNVLISIFIGIAIGIVIGMIALSFVSSMFDDKTE